jgi:molybdopterin synthase catalytic subunit
MAALQLQRLCGQALERWEWGKVVMLHRLGRVGLGEVSVLIGVAAVHRAVAFEACRWLIDALKVEVPIWKRDVFADGFVRWVEPNPGQNAASSDGMITDAGRPE